MIFILIKAYFFIGQYVPSNREAGGQHVRRDGALLI